MQTVKESKQNSSRPRSQNRINKENPNCTKSENENFNNLSRNLKGNHDIYKVNGLNFQIKRHRLLKK